MARDPKAEVELTANSRSLGARLREARAKFTKFGADLKREVFGKDLVDKGFWSKGGAQMVGNLGSSAASAIGGFVADQAVSAFKLQDSLTRLMITAEKSPEVMARFAQSVRKSSDETGINQQKIMDAGAAYVALTGDMDGAMSKTAVWARVAQATNSSISDIAQTSAALSQQLHITAADEEAAFSALAEQGKMGAIELKDLAAQMSTIAPQWAMFKGGTGMTGLRELGSALQVVKRGFGGDASETVTGLQGMLTALVKNSKRFQAGGVKIFDVDPKTHVKTMRNVLEIVRDIGDSKLVKDPAKLEKAFGRVEAYRAFLQLNQNKQVLDELIEKSQDAGVIQRDLDTYLNSSSGKVAKAWEQAKNSIMEAFTPERIENFARVATQLAGALGTIAGKIGDVLDGARKAGEGAARIIGGESEEDRIQGIKNERMDERKQYLRDLYDQARPGATQNDTYKEQRENAVMNQLAQEQLIKRALNPNLGDQHRDALTATHQSQNEYTLDELKTLRGNVQNWSDAAMINKMIDGAVTKLVKEQAAALHATVNKALGVDKMVSAITRIGLEQIKAIREAFSKVDLTVKVDGDKVVKAHQNAKTHATRPGG